VVSDLHLGARTEVDVLRRAEVRESLVAAVSGVDRLVLLGDTLEFRHGPLRDALDVAEPILRELGEALGPQGEAVIVFGNHDHLLLRGWLARRAGTGAMPPLGLETEIDWREGEPLEEIASWLAPARVRAAYPGVWLRDDVYAIHGHYGDRHNTVPILERLGAGVMARLVNEPEGGPRSAEDYEGTLSPMYAWIDTVAQTGGVRGRGGGSLQVRAWHALQGPGGRTVRSAGIAAAFGGMVAVLNRAGLGPFGADVSAPALRQGGLHGISEVLERLGVEARYVIFGHTHRAGPGPSDDVSEWQTTGGIALLNTGSWVHDRNWTGNSTSGSPYRPGFSVLLDDDQAPRLVNLLDAERPQLRQLDLDRA
jgi:Calcineurin-like phosphoesterase